VQLWQLQRHRARRVARLRLAPSLQSSSGMHVIRTSLVAAIAAILCVATAAADSERRPPPPREPPPAAIDACAGAASGDACSFDTPRGDELSGTCRLVGPDDDQILACVPKGHRPPPPDQD
jgi:hypothetical protein